MLSELRAPSDILISLNEAASLLRTRPRELLEAAGLENDCIAARHPEHGFFGVNSIEGWRELLTPATEMSPFDFDAWDRVVYLGGLYIVDSRNRHGVTLVDAESETVETYVPASELHRIERFA